MSKVILSHVGSLIDATTAASTINSNNTTITNAFDNTLSLNGSSPNQLQSSIDMNSFRILNLPTAISPQEPLTKASFDASLISKGNVPSGGVAGQVLMKLTNTSFDTSWQFISSIPFAEIETPILRILGSISGYTQLIVSANAAGVITLPPNSTTMVGTDIVQTLTNKTLISPIITTVQLGGSVSGFTFLTAQAVAAGVITIPANTTTMVGTDITQTLTNKVISGSSNTLTSIGNSSLTNSSVTIGSTSVTLGATVATFAGVTLTSPTLTTPALGVATATSLNGLTISTSSGTLSIANTKTTTVSNTLTFTGTDGSTLNVGTGGTLGTNAYTSTAYAPLASPTFTGTPLTTTAAVDTNTTQIASTAFVIAQSASATPLIDGTATVGTSTRFARGDHVHPTDTSRAPLASPTFTGTVTHPTPFTLGAISVTTTGTQLNYLNAATGTTGTTSTNVVFSTSPTLVTPVLGTPSSGTLTSCTGLPLTSGVTGILPVANGGTGNAGGAWTTATPTPTSSSGSFTTVSAVAHYLIEGKKLTYTVLVSITSAGTASGLINITLPGTAPASTGGAFSGVESATSVGCIASVGSGSSTLQISKYDGTTIIASGRFVLVSGVIEIQ